MTKTASKIVLIIFCGFIGLFFALNLILPDRDFSEQENKYLQERPELDASDLISGKYMSTFETWTTDQFTLRDKWISVKARCELLWGKGVNNGVYLCDNGNLLKCFEKPDAALLYENIAAVNTLAASFEMPVYFALIPDKSELYSELLPDGAPNSSESEEIESIYRQTDAQCIDVGNELTAHKDEYTFYRTDHHWTSLGAYYGYRAVVTAMGFEPLGLDSFNERKEVTDKFYGTTWSSSGFTWVEPDEMEIFVPASDETVINYPYGQPVESALYDFSALEIKDKYKLFLGGNTPLLTIDTASDGPSLLILRDSYADSMTPFLLKHFSKIHIIDLRYYKTSLAEYIAANDIDRILIMFSTPNFCIDSSIYLAGK